MEKENNIYIGILLDSLEKKEQLLSQILDITMQQDAILSSEDLNMEAFDITMDEKQNLIDKVEHLDLGFESVYTRVSDELVGHKNLYQTEILKMQSLITNLTEISVRLQTMEERNKVKLGLYLTNEKQKIKLSKLSSQTVTSYYKNMANQHQGQSYFLDKKK